MSTLVADAVLGSKLSRVTEPVDIIDPSGRKLGRYVPHVTVSEPLVPWDPTITKEELDRRAAEPGGIPLAEFWRRIGQK